MIPEQDPLAPFDNSRAALAFALNAHMVAAPVAVMNRMMAAVRALPKVPKKWLNRQPLELQDAVAFLHKERTRRDPGARPAPLIGLDRAHAAGLILHYFRKMDEHHQIVLTGQLVTDRVPCECKSLCCSGWRPVTMWQVAVRDACVLLERQADVLKEPGKKGFSTSPVLRKRVVEQWFLLGRPGHRELTLEELAAEAQMSLSTVARHRGWMTEYLHAVEDEAWIQVDAIFDGAGITGAWS